MIENSIMSLVSLKEIPFSKMGDVAQEIQIYELLSQEMNKMETFKNILELYQTQLSTSSYIFIK